MTRNNICHFVVASGPEVFDCDVARLLLRSEMANPNTVDLQEGELELVMGVALPMVVRVVMFVAVLELEGGGKGGWR